MLKKVVNVLKNPKRLFLYIISFRAFRFLPDELYLKIKFRLITGKRLNLNNPMTFNEKLQWLKLYDRKPEYTLMVDKYCVRKYIKDTIGEKYLIPLLGIYDKFEDINFDKLPNQFVLKPNHTSGDVFICRDKSKIDYKKLRNEVNKWLKREYFWLHREWPYKDIKPKIICEEFISDSKDIPDDYKILCFNGKAKLIEVHIDRYGDHRQDFYDLNWNKTTISQNPPKSDIVYKKPNKFDEMIKLSEILAANMVHVRIDWFIVKDKLYFGEITFYDGSGFVPFDDEKDDLLLGSWIELPKNVKENKSGVGEHFEL